MDRPVRRPHAFICCFFLVERADGRIREKQSDWLTGPSNIPYLVIDDLSCYFWPKLKHSSPAIPSSIPRSVIYRLLRVPSCHMKLVDLMEGRYHERATWQHHRCCSNKTKFNRGFLIRQSSLVRRNAPFSLLCRSGIYCQASLVMRAIFHTWSPDRMIFAHRMLGSCTLAIGNLEDAGVYTY